jgi:hypothetical protein
LKLVSFSLIYYHSAAGDPCPSEPTLAILVVCEPPGDALRGGCRPRGRRKWKIDEMLCVPLRSHAWLASRPPETRIGGWGCVEGARRGPAREPGASLARRVSVGPQARACAGARCPVWSTQAASRTPRNPIQAERTQAELRIRRVDRAWKSENGRTNPARIGWKEMHNLFCTMRFGRRTKTNWHLTTWTDCGKRTRAGSPVASDHARRREHC